MTKKKCATIILATLALSIIFTGSIFAYSSSSNNVSNVQHLTPKTNPAKASEVLDVQNDIKLGNVEVAVPTK
ncbi:hypothetical protein D1872_235690 [compost metagenome]